MNKPPFSVIFSSPSHILFKSLWIGNEVEWNFKKFSYHPLFENNKKPWSLYTAAIIQIFHTVQSILVYFIVSNITLDYATSILDIIWYHDGKIIKQSHKVRIKIKDNKTSVTINKCEPEDCGLYVCKAVSRIGETVTQAKLSVKSRST